MIKPTLLCLTTLLIGFSSAPAETKKPSGDDAVFKNLIQQYYAAWSTADVSKPEPLYAQDADLVFYDVAPLKYNGWGEYKVGVQKGLFDAMASGAITAKDDLKVTRRGNIAWTTVTGHISAKMQDGKSLEADLRHTAIWEKRGGKWLIIHEHVSVPMQ